MSTPIQNRYDFVLFFDVEYGNPNGDPDLGNMPRIDAETSHGFVTDVCLKRKTRNYIELIKGGEAGFEIYVKEATPLNNQHNRAFTANGFQLTKEQLKKPDVKTLSIVRKWMCDNFYDIRTFGAVMTTEVNCGQVRGPVQINFARSVDPIVQQDVSIARITVTNVKDESKGTTFGRKYIIPYALYRVEGYVSAKLANDAIKGTGFSEEDLALLWDALMNMFEHDHSASRGKMAARRLVIFKHGSELGNAPAHKLFERVTVQRKHSGQPPRSYSDYIVCVDHEGLSDQVEIIEQE